MPTAGCGADWEDGSVNIFDLNIFDRDFNELAPGHRRPCDRGEAVETRRAVMADQAGKAIKECEG